MWIISLAFIPANLFCLALLAWGVQIRSRAHLAFVILGIVVNLAALTLNSVAVVRAISS